MQQVSQASKSTEECKINEWASLEKMKLLNNIIMHENLTDFLKIKLTKFAVIWVKRHQKVGFLKGYSQLMHMRIRYHFLADLHVTRNT